MKTRIRAVAMLGVALLIGCGDEESRIKLVPVTGTITENGKPLAGATVTFTPEAGNSASTPGVDATGPDGNYRVRFKSRTGLAVGKYRVVVMPPLELPAGQEIPVGLENDPLMVQLMLGNDPGAAKSKKKEAGEKQEFEAEVAKDGENIFDFDVKTTAKK